VDKNVVPVGLMRACIEATHEICGLWPASAAASRFLASAPER
jgi:hypothetical protein